MGQLPLRNIGNRIGVADEECTLRPQPLACGEHCADTGGGGVAGLFGALGLHGSALFHQLREARQLISLHIRHCVICDAVVPPGHDIEPLSRRSTERFILPG